jgi:hypothetical protein
VITKCFVAEQMKLGIKEGSNEDLMKDLAAWFWYLQQKYETLQLFFWVWNNCSSELWLLQLWNSGSFLHMDDFVSLMDISV